jgi:radical SAM superfamily enzyme YgiQ (UPF0313 family)
MKILLIRPRPDPETIGLQHVMVCEPLELEYLGAVALDLGVQVEIVDMILETRPLDWFIQLHQPDIVGMTGYITHVGIIRSYAKQIKQILPNCLVIVGGVHAEVLPEDFSCPEIDWVVVRNSLQVFKHIIQDPKGGPWEGVYQAGIEGVRCAEVPMIMPARDLVSKYRSRYYYMFHQPCALIKTSYGCPFSCRFCFCREITGREYATRNLQSVIDEIHQIPEKEIYIVDDDFMVSRERVLDFCQMLQKSGLDKHFLIYARTDFIAMNEDVVEVFRDHGLKAVIIGLESNREADLDRYHKHNSIANNEAAVRILHKHGVDIYGTIILGPDFSRQDFVHLGNWITKLGIFFINLQPLTPLRGTELYTDYRDQIILSELDYPYWDLAHLVIRPEHMSIRRYYWEIIRLYGRIMINPRSAWMMVQRYGFRPTLKMAIGSSKVAWQYWKKIWKGK